MSAQVGTAFVPLTYVGKKPSGESTEILPDGLKVVIPVDPTPVTVYRIQNTETGEFRTKRSWGRRWNKKGKVYLRKCDVTNVLNCMSVRDREIARVVTYIMTLPVEKKADVDSEETANKQVLTLRSALSSTMKAVELLSQLTDKNLGVINDRLAGLELDINDLRSKLEEERSCGYR